MRGKASVISAGATEKYKNECYKTVNQEYTALSCTSKGDCGNCAANAVASLAATAVASLAATAAVALLAVDLK